MTIDFKKYSKEKPEKEGWYIWRVPHRYRPQVIITFIAENRRRGAGYEQIVSPAFDYWDGYKVHVPDAVEWAELIVPKKGNRCEVLSVNDLKISSCPFCKANPKLEYSGRFIAATPIDSEWWRLKCCGYATTPRFGDPVLLIEERNKRLTDPDREEL